MNNSTKLLSDLIVYMKYARYLPREKRRETWEEIIDRNVEMHCRKFPSLEREIREAFQPVYERTVVPSGRALQFAGKPIEIFPSRLYNCSAIAVDRSEVFSEIMFLLLGGSGVTYSVQFHHISQLPEIKQLLPRRRRFLIGDSIEGWADAVRALMKSYFQGQSEIDFDYRDIRPEGTPLVTSGGKAPGPEPLRNCLNQIATILRKKKPGTKLTSLECHSVICHIADCVLSGGIRRAACMAIFSLNDQEMIGSKFGNWFETNPHFGRANNSALLLRYRITKDKFDEYFEKMRLGGGDPGIYFSNNSEWLPNPCAEVSLRASGGFCNLTTFNISDIPSHEELLRRVRSATIIGTLQATYTDFHYLRGVWKRNADREALIGVSPTGLATNKLGRINLQAAAKEVMKVNEEWARKLGINKAARTTVLKPAGTTSLIFGSSSGIHRWFAPYYIRRVQVLKHEAVYKYFAKYCPSLVEDYIGNPKQAVISVPVEAPIGAITRNESAITQLERIKKVYSEWIIPGHREGDNRNNISATVYVKESEWDNVHEWMWENREHYNGITLLPFNTKAYPQAPHEEITREKFEELSSQIKEINFIQLLEEEDNTDLQGEIACSGDSCEIV